MKTVILCGGFGTRLREETEFRPKPMVEVGGKPILWHIMSVFNHYGYTDFVLCLGYKGEFIKHYFINYKLENSDVTVDLRSGDANVHDGVADNDWVVTLANTGLNAMTGARVKRVSKYIAGERFFLTYGDGVADVDLDALLAFHVGHGRLTTLTGVRPPGRFGELNVAGHQVSTFVEKPEVSAGYINGGFLVCEPGFLDYLSEDDSCVLERDPLENLARDGELMMFPHNGYWQCMDTYRDYQALNELWASGKAPWKIWD